MIALLAAAPGDTIECGTDASSWWSDWSVPGCTDPEPLATAALNGVFGDQWITDAKNGVSDVLKTLVTFWISTPDPKLINSDGGIAEQVSFLQTRLAWLAAVVMCFLFLFQIGRTMWEQNGNGAKLILASLTAYFIVVAISLPLITASIAVTSAIAKGILDASTVGTSFADNLFSLFNTTAGITSTILLVVFLIIAMILGGILCVLMIARGGALYVIAGSLVLAASGYASVTGKEAFNRLRGWIIALVLYKLVAAAILGVGFRFLGTDVDTKDNGMLQILYGFTLLFMAIFALPATLRLVAPATEPMAGGRGAGATVSTAATIGAGTVVRSVA